MGGDSPGNGEDRVVDNPAGVNTRPGFDVTIPIRATIGEWVVGPGEDETICHHA
jgi:hypothetical protein